MSSRRIHPSSSDAGRARRAAPPPAPAAGRPAAVYTVWKRSSMGFQGTDGFSVYDAAGNLAFRVDNYSRRRKLCAGELLLMDGHGAPLLSLRPQLLSLHDRWNCYTATEDNESPCSNKKKRQSSALPHLVFTMHKRSPLRSSDQAEVHLPTAAAPTGGSAAAAPPPGRISFLRIEGSFSRRNCKIVRGSDGDGKEVEVARISRKSAGVASRPDQAVATLGDDVFSLVVRPAGVDAATVMAVVIVMDRICRRAYMPMACSSQ